MAPFLRKLRSWRYKDFASMDYFLMAPGNYGGAPSGSDCLRISNGINALPRHLELWQTLEQSCLGAWCQQTKPFGSHHRIFEHDVPGDGIEICQIQMNELFAHTEGHT